MRLFTILFVSAFAAMAWAEPLSLPAPQTDGGMPLAEALSNRQTVRRFPNARKPTEQQLSNLLWAANGVNRSNGKRTAPSAMNRQEIQLAVLTEDGLFTYDAKTNTLTAVATDTIPDDLRGEASLYIILYYDKQVQGREWALVDAGFVGQNIYLWCASENWKTVFLGSLDRPRIAALLGCDPEEVLFAQKVGIN